MDKWTTRSATESCPLIHSLCAITVRIEVSRVLVGQFTIGLVVGCGILLVQRLFFAIAGVRFSGCLILTPAPTPGRGRVLSPCRLHGRTGALCGRRSTPDFSRRSEDGHVTRPRRLSAEHAETALII